VSIAHAEFGNVNSLPQPCDLLLFSYPCRTKGLNVFRDELVGRATATIASSPYTMLFPSTRDLSPRIGQVAKPVWRSNTPAASFETLHSNILHLSLVNVSPSRTPRSTSARRSRPVRPRTRFEPDPLYPVLRGASHSARFRQCNTCNVTG